MATFKELTTTFSTAVGTRRYVLPSLVLAIGASLDFLLIRYGILDAESPFAFLPFVLGVTLAGLLVLWWLLDYAADSRSELKGIVNIEQALDGLSTHFDEGAQLFDANVTSDAQLQQWEARRTAWQQVVQEYLQENFGLRERNMFRNVVLLHPHVIPGSYNDAHNHKRSLVAQQLEQIREAIIRYSDLVAKRRAKNI